MAQQDLRSVYLYVVDDVVSKMKPEFVTAGIDESVLLTLRERWQARMGERGLLDPPDATRDATTFSARFKLDEAQPSSSRPASQPSTSRPAGNTISTDGPLANLMLPDSRKRPYDGSGPSQPPLKLEPPYAIPQQDGNGDGPDGGEEDEEDAEAGAGGDDEEEQAEDDEADEDLNLSDSDDENKELEESCPNSLICLYEKVHRSKSRWRCTLRNGVFNIDGKDYLFNKAMADLQF